MLEHGGRLVPASRRSGIARERWLDLSTGISPWSWIEDAGFAPAARSWQRLPEDDDGLEDLAAGHYGAPCLAVPGTQAAIQALPRIRAPARVGVLAPCYAEHAQAWERGGHRVLRLAADRIPAALDTLDVLVLCNPNNPDGRRFARERLLDWHARLATRGGWLVLDETFIDADPGDSLATHAAQAGLIVLRSLGKFFGLAGARVGFVLAHEPLRARLREALGPWCVCGPAREVAMQALADPAWQNMQRARLHAASERLAALLSAEGFDQTGGCALFRSLRTSRARAIADTLAAQAILVRRFREPESLRFGLPRSEDDWRRLRDALAGARVAILRAATE